MVEYYIQQMYHHTYSTLTKHYLATLHLSTYGIIKKEVDLVEETKSLLIRSLQ